MLKQDQSVCKQFLDKQAIYTTDKSQVFKIRNGTINLIKLQLKNYLNKLHAIKLKKKENHEQLKTKPISDLMSGT